MCLKRTGKEREAPLKGHVFIKAYGFWLRKACLILFASLLAQFPTFLFAQSVTVTPDRTSLALGETLRLSIVLSGSFDDIRGPDMPDFDVVGRSSGTSISVIGGVIRQEQRIDLVLAPRREGRLRIGPVEVLREGKVVGSSNPIFIEVSKGVVRQKPLPAPVPREEGEEEAQGPKAKEDLAKRMAFIMVSVPERTLYVHEPIHVEYDLYIRSDVPLQGFDIEKHPDFKGFVTEKVRGPEEQGRRERVGPYIFRRYVLWEGVVTALGPGKATLDPISVIFVAGDLFTERRYRVMSEPLTLDFQPLPLAGRPADFVEGTVGSFVITASLDKKVLTVGDSALLSVKVSGSGNLRAIKAPSIREMEGLRIVSVPSSDLDEYKVDQAGVSGHRAFQFLVTAEREGDFEIPRLELPFFNPITGKYERTRSEPIKLRVMGKGPIQEVRKAPEQIVEVLSSLDLSRKGEESTRESSEGDTFFLPAVAAPFVFFLFCDIFVRLRSRAERTKDIRRKRNALKVAKARLSSIGKSGLEAAAFWGQVEDVIRQFLLDRFDISFGATHLEIAERLSSLGASDGDIEALVSELDACAFGRFAPTKAIDRGREEALTRIRRCLESLDGLKDGAVYEGQ